MNIIKLSYRNMTSHPLSTALSLVLLTLKPNHPQFRMDLVVTIKGSLKLNQDDIYQCNYILEEAGVHNE